MFEKVNIPIIGIVENMAMHTCSKCGNEEHIFGSGGAEKMCQVTCNNGVDVFCFNVS